MKTNLISLLVGLWLALSANWVSAQSYSIDWYKISGGGGTSSNGQYIVSGTIGQHDAGGPMTNGNYSLTGGFWSLLSVVQTPGSPLLRIFLTTTNTAVVAWPAPSAGFNLQQNSDPGTASWTGVGNPVNVVGSENQVVISPPSGKDFFRLKSP
jgi:hypothetical protein